MIGSVVAAWWGFGGYCSRIDSRFPIKKNREALQFYGVGRVFFEKPASIFRKML